MVKRPVWKRFLALLYPERCCCCGKAVACGSIVCGDCRPRLKQILSPICKFCGRSLSDCSCGKHRMHTDRCIAPFYYEDAARLALHRLKFGNKPYVSEMFFLSMAQTILREYNNVKFDCIVSVPISKRVHIERKYNQSQLLAKGLSDILGIPCKDLLVKRYETIPQRELPAYRRSGNVLGAFDVSYKKAEDVKLNTGFVVLLIDDTVTTGATLDECSKILKLNGASKVYAVTATASRLSDYER